MKNCSGAILKKSATFRFEKSAKNVKKWVRKLKKKLFSLINNSPYKKQSHSI